MSERKNMKIGNSGPYFFKVGFGVYVSGCDARIIIVILEQLWV